MITMWSKGGSDPNGLYSSEYRKCANAAITEPIAIVRRRSEGEDEDEEIEPFVTGRALRCGTAICTYLCDGVV